MVTETVYNGVWVCSTETIASILSPIRAAWKCLRDHGFVDVFARACEGCHEADTGFEAFYREYTSFSEMKEWLMADFAKKEAELDRLWFHTLNFEQIVLKMAKLGRDATIRFCRGALTVDCGVGQEAEYLEKVCADAMRPYRWIVYCSTCSKLLQDGGTIHERSYSLDGRLFCLSCLSRRT